jgi:hypothetical protein
MSLKSPKIDKPPPPANAPTRADSSVVQAGIKPLDIGYSSLISTGPQGLQRKAQGGRRSLIGGGTTV